MTSVMSASKPMQAEPDPAPINSGCTNPKVSEDYALDECGCDVQCIDESTKKTKPISQHASPAKKHGPIAHKVSDQKEIEMHMSPGTREKLKQKTETRTRSPKHVTKINVSKTPAKIDSGPKKPKISDEHVAEHIAG
eukprot:TRINITY_DN6615_c0_g1_i1.p1 TRINITY_DN6615_c0_g1~~TRINITY_DN6615_c0_g1_i1.p1  ORF type:complete len:137 (-),score=25.95 TRINITY_DN6615_c0_g1_i1:124-534(-)